MRRDEKMKFYLFLFIFKMIPGTPTRDPGTPTYPGPLPGTPTYPGPWGENEAHIFSEGRENES